MTAIVPTFSGEMQLAGWAETHTGGCKVTFWLPSSEDLDVFRALTVRKGNLAGQRFMAVLVEIGDDEQPVREDAAPALAVGRAKGGALSKLSGIWCGDRHFQAWLTIEFPKFGEIGNASEAADVVRNVCGVDSRADFDNNKLAGQLFQQRIRAPYIRHCAITGVAV